MQKEIMTEITAQEIPERQRLSTLPHYFREYVLDIEPMVYSVMGELCNSYKSGYWKFVALSNGGFYMALATDNAITLANPMNYSEEQLTADAAGIVVCLMAYNRLLFRFRSGLFEEAMFALRDYALGHPESAAIVRLID